MPVGTAAGRLRKQIMFELIGRQGLDTCFRCGQKIESAEELSIDHKQDWIDNHELFWDLDNIAFSHFLCNSVASFRSGKRQPSKYRKVGPPNTAWCQSHQQFLPIENFYPRKDHWNGVDPYCKECKRKQFKR